MKFCDDAKILSENSHETLMEIKYLCNGIIETKILRNANAPIV